MSSEDRAAFQLTVDGHVGTPRILSHAELAEIDSACRIEDVSQLDPARHGTAVKLRALLELAGSTEIPPDRIAIHSDDGYRVEVPLDLVIDRAVVVYAIGNQPLPVEFGGPLRFLVPNAAACKTAEIDTCGNVKGLARLELVSSSGGAT